MLIHLPRNVSLFHSGHPPNVVIVSFAAEGTRVIRLLGFLSFIEYVAFLHHEIIVAFLGKKSEVGSPNTEGRRRTAVREIQNPNLQAKPLSSQFAKYNARIFPDF